ncbi:lysogenization regulator HflD [Parashewanella spongiae]|uniref:High frequency lysogenization protein HflD homolog n=1 Tax=Parashewanella spongiae TaxID=342950 RepID=A0A3A6U3R5_9GAMM|nr:high frequency lysogenization protein HflD [Parashewanella spongiae]MCL1077219.1 high frequency lysogenization protein HflD [Parashewanella spongiae]RJY18702.1 lysogenization regulator HflD [Parashewanella spongiae]
MNQQLIDRTKAFSATIHALAQVQIIARNDSFNNEAIEDCLNTLVVTDPDKIADIYPNERMLKDGYHTLLKQLEDRKQKDIELTRYLVGILSLERKLSRSGSMSDMANRIDEINRQLAHFKITDEQVIANLSSIYTDLISNLGPKIVVAGNPNVINRPITMHRIRALLLSAIRNAVLWRQLGGKRRDLIFSRKSIIDAAKYNLNN